MRNYAGTCKGIYSYNLVYNILIQLLPLQSSVFGMHFSNAFLHENEAFLKGISQNKIVPLLVIFHLPYSSYRGVKICFYLCRYQNQNFFLEPHSHRSCGTRVALVSHSRCPYLILVVLVSFVPHSFRIRVARVAIVSLVSVTHVVKQARSKLCLRK